MNENNGFILKPEMYNQEEWCKMFMKSIETINNLQSKIDKAIEVIDLITPELWDISNKMTYRLKDVKNILKEVNCDEVK